MGIDFSKVTPPASPVESAPAASTEIETVQPYDIMADRQQMNETLTNSEEVDALVSTIEVNNLETIVLSVQRRQRRLQKHRMLF